MENKIEACDRQSKRQMPFGYFEERQLLPMSNPGFRSEKQVG